MKIYNLPEEFRTKCVIDLEQYSSLDEYLLKNRLTRRLVYYYLKLTKNQQIQLSYLDEIFKNTSSYDELISEKQQSYLKSDQVYKKVFQKYISVPEIWTNGVNQIQAFYFDNKYLLNGKYQIYAHYADDFIQHYSNIHYVENLSSIRNRNSEHLKYYNDWFKTKRRLERSFYEKILKKFDFSETLKIKYYWKYLEIFDTESLLTLQFEIRFGSNTTVRVLMPDDVKRSSFGRRNTLAFKFLTKHQTVSDLYRYFVNYENFDEVNEFTKELDSLEADQRFKMIQSKMIQILEDLRNEDESACYLNDYLSLYLIHYNSIEKNTIHYSEKNKLLRYYRQIKYEDGSIQKLSSYNLPKNVKIASKHLIMSGFVSILPYKDSFDEKEYFLVSKDEHENLYAIQFLRTPIKDVADEVSNHYLHYEKSLRLDIEHLQETGQKISFDDTRKYHQEQKFKRFKYLDYFSLLENEFNEEKFIQETEERERRIDERLNEYFVNNESIIYTTNSIIDSKMKKTKTT